MKRVILLTGIMMFVWVNAFATTLAVPATVAPAGFSASKNVIVGYGSGNATGGACTAAAGDCVHFGATAKNTSGDKIYGAVDTKSFVYMSSGAAGSTLTTLGTSACMPIPTAADYTPTGWTSM